MSDVGAILILLALASVGGFVGGAGFAALLLWRLDRAIDTRFDEMERRFFSDTEEGEGADG